MNKLLVPPTSDGQLEKSVQSYREATLRQTEYKPLSFPKTLTDGHLESLGQKEINQLEYCLCKMKN